MSDDPQQFLFDPGEWWEEHWQGMPEFVQNDLSPFRTIYVHFDKPEDMQQFSSLVGQPIGPNTKYIWYPEADIGRIADKRYIDAAQCDDVEVLDAE